MSLKQKSDYDVIVIGGGPAGLSCATALAKARRSVIVLERNEKCGGNCSEFSVDGYTFDLAVHQVVGADGPDGYCSKLFDYYDIKRSVNFYPVDSFATVIAGETQFELPVSLEKFRKMLQENFPAETADIDAFIKYLMDFRTDSKMTGDLLRKRKHLNRDNCYAIGLLGKFSFLSRVLRWFSDLSKPADELLNRYIRNKKLRAFIGAGWPYLGLPPSRLSGLLFLSLVNSVVIEGTYYPKEGSQAISDELVQRIKDFGGEVRVKAAATGIVVERGAAAGVLLESGEKITAKAIVSGIDAKQTFGGLLKKSELPAGFLKKLDKCEASLGPFKVFLGLDYQVREMGFDQHEYFFFNSLDYDQCYSEMKRGYPGAVIVYSPTYLRPDSVPQGHSTLILTTFFPWHTQRDWRDHKTEIAEEMIAMVEKKFAGISQHIKVRKILTPEDLREFSLAYNGAMYGWANTPGQSLINRLPQKTPIKNLFLTGHWTMPGSGVSSAVISGWMVSQKIIGKII